MASNPSQLTPAERVVEELLPDALVFSAPIARDIVAAVRPIIAAEALRWVASQDTRWDGYCCHDHMAEVVLDAADEIEAGVDTIDPAAAVAALDERRVLVKVEALREAIYELESAPPHGDGLDAGVRAAIRDLRRLITGLEGRGDGR